MSKKSLLKKVVVVFFLVLLFLQLAPEPFPFDKGKYDLVIGQISDPHIGFLGSSGLAPLALYRASQETDLIVVTGDCTETHSGQEGEFVLLRRLLDQYATVPVRFVPGNHDSPKLFKQYLGDLEWIWDIEDYRLVGLNSRPGRLILTFWRQPARPKNRSFFLPTTILS